MQTIPSLSNPSNLSPTLYSSFSDKNTLIEKNVQKWWVLSIQWVNVAACRTTKLWNDTGEKTVLSGWYPVCFIKSLLAQNQSNAHCIPSWKNPQGISYCIVKRFLSVTGNIRQHFGTLFGQILVLFMLLKCLRNKMNHLVLAAVMPSFELFLIKCIV